MLSKTDTSKDNPFFKQSSGQSFSSVFQQKSLFGQFLQHLLDKQVEVTQQTELLQNAIERVSESLHTDVFTSSLKTQNDPAVINTRAIIGYFSERLFALAHAYKTPITKLSLVLNPNYLGEVELNFTQIGKDFYVQIGSNFEVLRLLAQNAKVLKEELKRVGFSKVEIEFIEKKSQIIQSWNENGLLEHQSVINPQICRLTLSIYV